MNLIDLFLILGGGFIAWWLTGFYDDFLILVSVLKRHRSPPDVLRVFIGQLIGVLLVVSISLVLTDLLEPNVWTKRASGLILILIGIWFFISSNKSEGEKSRSSSLVIMAFLLYIFNALDDFTLVSASLLSLGLGAKILFCVGFILGWMSSFFMALKSLELNLINKLAKFAPFILITGGAILLISTLT